MAGREEESLDVKIVGMDLDEDCLVRVGRAGAGGAESCSERGTSIKAQYHGTMD